jgi:hypothetical protein
MATINNDKSFNAAIAGIKKNGEALASLVHATGLFALSQANLHGNTGFGERLMEALGKKHDAKRVEKWLCHFGKFGMKQGKLVYRARKDIGPENQDAMLAEAEATPYWELTEQAHHGFTFDGIASLKAIITRHETAVKKANAGEEVTMKNEGILAEVQALLAKFDKTPAPVQETNQTSIGLITA